MFIKALYMSEIWLKKQLLSVIWKEDPETHWYVVTDTDTFYCHINNNKQKAKELWNKSLQMFFILIKMLPKKSDLWYTVKDIG